MNIYFHPPLKGKTSTVECMKEIFTRKIKDYKNISHAKFQNKHSNEN
jgi:hypothetical protein